jgi:hypothetical protein
VQARASGRRRARNKSMGILIPLAILGVSLYLIFFVFFPLGRGAIYDPSTHEQTRRMVAVAGVAVGEKAVDLGSGDGRVVIALARLGAEAHGFEINPVLVLRSRRNIAEAGLSGRAHIHWGSFWRADFSGYDVVTTFQVGFVMGRLEAKLKRELKPTARIVSHHWRFPGLKPERVEEDMYVYRIGSGA